MVISGSRWSIKLRNKSGISRFGCIFYAVVPSLIPGIHVRNDSPHLPSETAKNILVAKSGDFEHRAAIRSLRIRIFYVLPGLRPGKQC